MNNTVEMNETLIRKMLAYYSGDPARIQHYTKVYTYASMIGHAEHLSMNCSIFWKPLQFFMTSVSKLQKKNITVLPDRCRKKKVRQLPARC